MSEKDDSQKLTKPFGRYVHTRIAGNLVFIAGQGCRDPETDAYAGLSKNPDGSVAAYDIQAQTRGVLQNIERALSSLKLNKNALVDVTVFLTDMKDFDGMNAVWNDYFADCTPPTRTTVAVRQLPGLNFVEMKAIAIL